LYQGCFPLADEEKARRFRTLFSPKIRREQGGKGGGGVISLDKGKKGGENFFSLNGGGEGNLLLEHGGGKREVINLNVLAAKEFTQLWIRGERREKGGNLLLSKIP